MSNSDATCPQIGVESRGKSYIAPIEKPLGKGGVGGSIPLGGTNNFNELVLCLRHRHCYNVALMASYGVLRI